MFLPGLEHRGENNLRKRIYMSAVTPDLYAAMYREKVIAFFDHLFDPRFAGQPLMRHYLDYYFDLYWNFHLGVQGDAIPPTFANSARVSTPCSRIGIRATRWSTSTT